MSDQDQRSQTRFAADLGERQRTWRMFLSAVRWSAGGLALVLLFLLLFARG